MANTKVNMSLTKAEMPEQDPVIRATNFEEVALGYDAETAMKEAARCLDCKNSPCREGCPVAVKIPRFLEKVREGDFEAAYEIITSTNSLPAVCGRVCPQEKQCESKCVRGIKGESVGIGRLERFVADWHMAEQAKKGEVKVDAPASNGHRIAGSRLQRPPHRHRRLRPCGPDLRGRPQEDGLRRDHLRGSAQIRRRAGLRHPPV